MAALIEEGSVKILLKSLHEYRGPGRRGTGFYNPTLEIDRDLTVAFCAHAAREGAYTFLDGLAATGIRGIRIAKEVGENLEVDINERKPESYELVKKNIALNEVKARALNHDLRMLLQQKKYDYIDIDPYGSPVPFLPYLFRALKKRTYLTVTATDTATLCGVWRRTCIRKYQAIPLKGETSKEAGLRILTGYIARQAAGEGYGFTPLLAYTRSHFFRVYGMMKRGVKAAEESLSHVGWIYWDDGWRTSPFQHFLGEPRAGPLWIGPLHDEAVLYDIQQEVETRKLKKKEELMKLLQYFHEEAHLPPLYYESSSIAKECRTSQPKMATILAELKDRGYEAGTCHFSPDAFKTDAPYEIITSLFG